MIAPGFEDADADGLAAAVRLTFPSLPFKRAILDDSGGDYRVLVLDGRYAFRFPRRPHHVGLQREIAVLKALQRRSDVRTPDYCFVDPQFRFAGYRFIAGTPLTPGRYVALAEGSRTRVLQDLASLLKVLHGLDATAVFAHRDWPQLWGPAEFVERALAKGAPLIDAYDQVLANDARSFLTRYGQEAVEPRNLIHGDLVAEHLLLDPTGERLAGVIDFGDCGLGDPADDFIGLWAFGGDAVHAALEAYGAGGRSEAMLERSRRGWARYCIDRLWQALLDKTMPEAKCWAACARAALDESALDEVHSGRSS